MIDFLELNLFNDQQQILTSSIKYSQQISS